MSSKTKYWTAGVAALALVALALPSLVVAQHGGRGASTMERGFAGKGYGGPGRAEMMHELLELSDEQSQEVDAMRIEHQQKQVRLKGRISAAEAELEALMMDPEASRSQVLAAGQELQKLRSQAATQRLEHRMDFRELLTPEQRAQLVKMGSRFTGGRGPHHLREFHGRGSHLERHEWHGRQGSRGSRGYEREQLEDRPDVEVEREVTGEGDRL